MPTPDWSLVLLVAALLLFVYPFALYPLLLPLVAGAFPWRRKGASARQAARPSVAFVVCALNEERIIRQKLENTLALRYPRERLRTVFVSDGSTDATAAIIGEYRSRGVELIERESRRGKVSNLNEVLSAAREDVLVLSDANVIYDPAALERLVARFDDPEVGGVSGKVVLTGTTDEFRSSEETYYSLEWRLQELASRLHSMPGADGAMYALRRPLFQPCPGDTLIEDYVIATSLVRQGHRMVFEPGALAWEQGPASLREEFRRKVRIAAGAAQAMVRGNGWPAGAPLPFWFVFVSHKLLRWLSPLSGLAALLAAAVAWPHWLAGLVLGGACVLALLAGVRWATGWTHPALNAPFYFVFGQVAQAIGLWRGALGRQSVLWAKANR